MLALKALSQLRADAHFSRFFKGFVGKQLILHISGQVVQVRDEGHREGMQREVTRTPRGHNKDPIEAVGHVASCLWNVTHPSSGCKRKRGRVAEVNSN